MSEFSRPFPIEAFSSDPRSIEISAGPEEREAMAARFGFVAIGGLEAEAMLSREGKNVTALGRLRARVTQNCVASAEPIEESVDETFRIEFRPHPGAARPDEEVELSEGEMDVVFYDGAMIDLGDAIAETLPLSVDPFPRSAIADTALSEAGVSSEEEARLRSSPFAALAALKDKLKP